MADNTFVNIGGHKVSAGIKYSTSEVKTGDVWIDGKPIYRRVIQATVTSYTIDGNRRAFISSTSISDINVINISGTYKTNLGYIYSINGTELNTDNSGLYATSVHYQNGDLKLIYNCNNALGTSSITFNVILEYTKTTDRT